MFFSTVEACESFSLSKVSMPALNLLCSASARMAVGIDKVVRRRDRVIENLVNKNSTVVGAASHQGVV